MQIKSRLRFRKRGKTVVNGKQVSVFIVAEVIFSHRRPVAAPCRTICESIILTEGKKRMEMESKN